MRADIMVVSDLRGSARLAPRFVVSALARGHIVEPDSRPHRRPFRDWPVVAVKPFGGIGWSIGAGVDEIHPVHESIMEIRHVHRYRFFVARKERTILIIHLFSTFVKLFIFVCCGTI